jgi:hypothetical protein
MSYEQEIRDIEERFDTLWSSEDGDRTFSNRSYTPKDRPWVRVTVKHNEAPRITLSQKWYRHTGIIFNQIFVEANKGEKAAMCLVDKISAIWRGQRFGGIQCQAVTVTNVGESNGWYQVNVSCPFYRDELLAN